MIHSLYQLATGDYHQVRAAIERGTSGKRFVYAGRRRPVLPPAA